MSYRRTRIDVERFRAFGELNVPRLRRVMLDGDRPETNVLARLPVCILLVAALSTIETQAFPVGCRDVATGTTPTACISWADNFRFDSNSRSLVLYFEPSISVGPAMDFRAEVFPFSQRTISYVRQVLKDYFTCIIGDRILNQGFGSTVQEHVGYGRLVPGHPLQEPSGTSGANRLNRTAGTSDAAATVIEPSSLEEERLRVGRVCCDQHPFDAHINANYAALLFEFRNLNLVAENQEPLFPCTFEFGILPATVRQRSGVFDGEKFTPKSDALLCSVEVSLPNNRQYSLLEHSPFPSLVGLGRFVGGTHGLAERAGQLRRKAHPSEPSVVGLSQSVRVQFFGLEGNSGKPVNGFEPTDKKGVSLFASGYFQLDCSYCFHYYLM